MIRLKINIIWFGVVGFETAKNHKKICTFTLEKKMILC